ncbi:glycosyltransferase family 2 protein [Methanobacterium oryzae]|uniref:glycosyltransferase family 2 protein n=1 Tax=Methanobacterium oryzae TaxID=69540 RepID=UPI003D1AE40C
MNKESVCAVVVTYNRKELLLECLEALKNQKYPLDAIYLVDNASTDDTTCLLLKKGYLKELPPEKLNENWESNLTINNTNNQELSIYYVRMSENTGGAGGFHEGVKRAYEKGYDWLWLMDDDTITTPNSLNNLLNKIELVKEKVGFACSKVLLNETVHWMNIPKTRRFINKTPFNSYDNLGILMVESASFVSVLISKIIIRDVGFPLKEFFIWADDIEYTERITKKGYMGIYVKDSVVYHKNEGYYNIISDNNRNSWKYFYGVRNNLYIIKKRNTFLFMTYFMYNITYRNIEILKCRKDSKLRFIWINTKASLASLVFNP